MTKDKALTLALEALENFKEVVVAAQVLGIKVGATGKNMRLGESFLHDEAIAAIKEALAQPEQEIDWKDMYEKEKRRSAMWLAKYEEVAGPAPKAYPQAQPEQKQTGIREIRVTETVKQEQEEDWDAMGQKILVATARDTKRTWEDAAVKAVHKLMQEGQEPGSPKYSFKAHWEKGGVIGVVGTIVRPDGGIYVLQEFIDSPKREWVGLSDKQKKHAEATCMRHGLDAAIYYIETTLKVNCK